MEQAGIVAIDLHSRFQQLLHKSVAGIVGHDGVVTCRQYQLHLHPTRRSRTECGGQRIVRDKIGGRQHQMAARLVDGQQQALLDAVTTNERA